MDKLKKMKQTTLLVLLVAALLMATVFTGYIHHRAAALGNAIGQTNGKIVGTAIGSAKGVTVGTQEGKEAGEQAGLSAEDTTVDIKGSMEALGKLEVLVAGVSLKNINKIGDSYTGLYLINGNAVFSVDLAEAEISFSQDGKDVYITIPEPDLEVYLDQNSTKKLAESQNFSFTVTAEDGLVAYLNTMTQTVEKVKETMVNYDSLFADSKESAKKQVQQLATTICGDNYIAHVQFK
ncbi:MAG: DUF4230 domain-containing protein [Bacteroidales bacterium]|nr:DUF4230 domain-containing protein [Bacteroidales bacterium]